MQNSYQVLGNKFDKLDFYAKSQVKRENSKKKSSVKKRARNVESKLDRLNFHAKSRVKSENYHKIKIDAPLKRYKILDQEQFL